MPLSHLAGLGQQRHNERRTNKLRTFTGLCLVLSLQDAQNFPTNLTNIARHERFWRMIAGHKKNILKNIKRTLTNNNEYIMFIVRMANPAKCDRGITWYQNFQQ